MSRWYWCLRHGRVEPEDACPHAQRLGPYATEEEAARAIETASARNEAWESDPHWRDDD